MTTRPNKEGNQMVMTTILLPIDLHRVARKHRINVSALTRNALCEKVLMEGLQ